MSRTAVVVVAVVGLILAACSTAAQPTGTTAPPVTSPPAGLGSGFAAFDCERGVPTHADIDYFPDAVGLATPEEAALQILEADPFFLEPAELVNRGRSAGRLVIEVFNDTGGKVAVVWVSPAPGDPTTYLVYTAEGCCPICAGPSSVLNEEIVVRFVDDLAVGFEDTGYVAGFPFSVPQRVLGRGGDSIRIFEYSSPDTRLVDSLTISPDGTSIGNTPVEWIGPPTFWVSEQLIVLYLGDDPAIIEGLTDLLGTPIAGPELQDCDSERAISGNFDGDGTTDLAVFDIETVELVVCTAQSTYAVPGSGHGEVLVAADLNGDGIDEILTGGTTAWGAGADMVAIVDGVLDYVHTPDGSRLTLWEGLPPDGFLAYGCADFTDNGKREVAIIEGALLSATEASWERSIYRIQGHDAIGVGTDRGTFDPSGSTDPLSTPEITNLRGASCSSTDS